MESLKGKTAIVTGASSGIGRATALAFAQAGVNVVVTARREQRLAELCEEIKALGAGAEFYAGDAAEQTTAIACVEMAVAEFGGLDILVNNAGLGNYKLLVDTSVEEYDELMNANMRSGFVFSRHAAPVMIEQESGVILFISSVAGLQGTPNEAVYCATKFAQAGFAQAIDGELRKHGVKVGTIYSGGVKSEFAVGHGRTEESVKASRMMAPEEVAETILFACSLPANVRIPAMTVRHMG